MLEFGHTASNAVGWDLCLCLTSTLSVVIKEKMETIAEIHFANICLANLIEHNLRK